MNRLKKYAPLSIVLTILTGYLIYPQLFKTEALKVAEVDHDLDEIVGRKFQKDASPSLSTESTEPTDNQLSAPTPES